MDVRPHRDVSFSCRVLHGPELGGIDGNAFRDVPVGWPVACVNYMYVWPHRTHTLRHIASLLAQLAHPEVTGMPGFEQEIN